MSRMSLGIVLVTLGLAGCAMEQYHFPQTQDKVPAKVIVAYSEDHPNEAIKSISESKMYDGSTRYSFIISDGKEPDKLVWYNSDGSKIRYTP